MSARRGDSMLYKRRGRALDEDVAARPAAAAAAAAAAAVALSAP